MSENSNLPEGVKAHLENLRKTLGNETGDALEKTLAELMKDLKVTTTSNPIESSALFLARPTGYVV